MRKRALTWFLVLILCISMLPAGAVSPGKESESPTPVETEVPPAEMEAPPDETENPPEEAAEEEPEEEPEDSLELLASTVSGDYTYTLSGSEATITGYAGAGGVVTVPVELDGNPVTAIGNYAFQNCTVLTSVSLPDGVTKIGSYAFDGCTALTSVSLPDGVREINSYAFRNCSALSQINYPKALSSAGSNIFKGCASLKEITVPQGVTTLPASVFRGADSLENVILPDGLTEIGTYAFYDCTALKTVELPDSLSKLNSSAFTGCTALEEIRIPGEVSALPSSAFQNCTSLAAVTMSVGLTKVDSYVFAGCTALTSVSLPDGVTKIDSYAFDGCAALTSVSLPDSVTAIGGYAFRNCAALAQINYPNGLTSAGNNIFAGCTSLKEFTVPEGVTALPAYLFRGAASLETVSLPDSLTSIGMYAFDGCTALKEVEIPAGVTVVGNYVFQRCTALTSVTLPDGLLEIGGQAFSGCTALTAIRLPDSVTKIGGNAFQDCTALAQVNYPKALTSAGGNLFQGCTSLKQIVVPEGVTTLPDSVFRYSTGLETVSLPSTLTKIGSHAFDRCTALKEIEIPAGVTVLPSNVFQDCTALTSVSLPDGLTEIGGYAFNDCAALEQLLLPDSVTEIGGYAFQNCTALKQFNYPLSLTSTGGGLFNNCTSLTTLQVPEGVTALPSNVFQNFRGLVSISLPTTLTKIGNYAFDGCTGLTSITLPDGLTEIGSYAFEGCTGLTALTLPDSVTTIGNYAFRNCSALSQFGYPANLTTVGGSSIFHGCTSLKQVSVPQGVTTLPDNLFRSFGTLESVELPSTLTSIGEYAFYQCTGLTELTIPAGVTTIGRYAFNGCTGLTAITLPDGVTDVGAYAFYQCTGLTAVTLPDSITNMGSYCFCRCANLTSVELPDGLTSIPSNAFEKCTALASVEMPAGLTVVGAYAFRGCTALVSLVMPDTLTDIGTYAFDGCTALRTVDMPPNVTFGSNAFRGCTFAGTCGTDMVWTFDLEKRSLSVTGAGAVTIEGEESPWLPWRNYVEHVELDSRVTELGDKAFAGCTALTSAVLPEGVETVGADAFAGCTALKRVELPDTVQAVGDGAFAGCDKVDTFIFCGDLPQLGKNALPTGSGYRAYYPKTASGWSDQAVSQYPNAQWSVWDDTLPTRDIVLLLDVSGSMAGSRLRALKEAVNRFADKVGGRLTNTRIAVISYSDDAQTDMPLSTDVEWLKSCVNALTDKGSTQYLRALSAAETMLEESDADVKSLILFSDGEPSDSESSILTQAASMRTSCYIYTVGLSPSDRQRQLLIDVAGTEKNYFEAENIDALVELFVSISDNIGEENLTEATMIRGGKQIDILRESQSFEQGSAEVVDLTVSPYWSDKVPGTIRITQRGKTVLENTDGKFTNVAPGQLFDPLETIYVVLVDADGAIAAMVKTKLDIAVSEQDRTQASTTDITLTVYENKKDSGDDASYRLSAGAKITAGGVSYLTGSDGRVQIPNPGTGSVTVSKDGYVSRTLTAGQFSISKKIYLQKTSDKPVISAVWLGNTDVLNQSCGMDLLSKEKITLQAEVTWGSSGQGTLTLVQDARRAAFTGNSLTVVLSDKFDVSQTIYVEAAAGGDKVRVPLKFESGSASAIPEVLDGASFSLGSSISLTLPENIQPEFFAGTEVSAGITSVIPVTMSTQDGKVYVAIGLDLGEYSATGGWDAGPDIEDRAPYLDDEVKTFVDKLKNTGVFDTSDMSDSMKKLLSLKQVYREVLDYPKGSFGFGADFTVLGFAEGYVNDRGGVTWLDGGVIINPSVEAEMDLPFALGPVPMYFEVGLSGEVTAQLNVIFNEAAKNFTPNGQISGAVTLSGGVGAGIKNVLYAGGGLEGSLKPDWRIYTGGRQDSFKLTATVNAYAKAGIAIFEYKKAWDPFYEAVWIEYPSGRSALMAAVPEGIYDPTSYTRKDLSYLDVGGQFLANSGGELSLLGSGAGLVGQTIKTNLYRESTPQYVRFADGAALAVWVDGTDSGLNSTQLYYSYYSGGTWSTPAPVDSDGTLDYAPQLQLIDGKAWLVWQNAARVFTTSDTLESIAPDFDVAASSFTPGEGFAEAVTFKREGLDMLPTLTGDSGGTVYAAWVNNSADDWFGSGENSILYTACTGEVWSDIKAAYTGLSAIDALAAGGDDDGLHLAWATGGALYEDGQAVEAAPQGAGQPCYLEGALYWVEEDGLTWKGNKSAPSLDGVSRFQLLTDGKRLAALYTTSSGLYSTLNLSYYNEELGQWCQPVALTDGKGFVGAYSGAMLADGTVEVLINNQQVTGAMGDDDPYGPAQLERITLAAVCNVTMGELIYDSTAYSAGSDMELSFQLANTGSKSVSSVRVDVTDEAGTVLSSIVMDDLLMPGQSIMTSTYFKVPAEAAGQRVTVTVTPEEDTDCDTSDNSQTAELSFEDLAVTGASWGEGAGGAAVVFADVVNYGYTTRAGIAVELRSGSPTGKVVEKITIDALEPLGLQQVSFQLDAPDSQVYYIAIADSGDVFAANDSAFVALSGEMVPQFAQVEAVTAGGVSLILSNEQGGTCMAAVYDANGRMLTVGAAQVSANAGAVDISFPAFDESRGAVLKIFLVDSEQNPLCPCVEKELN